MNYIDINKRQTEHSNSMSDLHSHSHYEVYYLTKGKRLFFLENRMYEITEPTLIIIPPHIMHKTEGGAFTRYNINVSPKHLNSIQTEILNGLRLKIIKPSSREDMEIQKILGMAADLKSNKQYFSEVLFSYFIFVLSKIDFNTDDRSSDSSKPMPPIMLKITAYMYRHFAENITLNGISEKFYVSKSTLNHSFKKYTGLSPMEFFLEIRLAKAKEMLLSSEKSIQEISAECGFSSPNYFGLIFKRHETVSPSIYRQKDR